MMRSVGRFALAAALVSVLLFTAIVLDAAYVEAADNVKSVKIATKVTGVTVYSGVALVTRKGTVAVPVGDFELVCSDLPDYFIPQSLNVSAMGDVKTDILNINVERCNPLSKKSKRYTELKRKLEDLRDRMDAIKSNLSSISKKKDLLTAMGEYSADETHKQIALQRVNLESWKGVLDFYESEYEGIEKENAKLVKEKAKLQKDIDWVSSVIDSMNYSGKSCRNIIVKCSSEAPGTLSVEFSYLVNFAFWAPEYIVTLDKENDKITLGYNARVSQSSGEDWDNVEIILSTATPGIGARPPKLKPYFLSTSVVNIAPLHFDKIISTPPPPPSKSGAGRSEEGIHVRGGRSGHVSYQAEKPELTGMNTPFSTNFIVPRPVSLKSGGEKKRFLIKQSELKGEFSLYSVPSISKNVFIKSSITNTTGIPILAGPVEVYVKTGGGKQKVTNYVGKDSWESIANGQKFDMFFGVDQDIKVKHKLLKKEVLSKAGASKKRIRYSYLTTLQSFKKKDVDIVVRDRIPVSIDKDVKVSGVKIEPKEYVKEGDGLIKWKLTLTPKVKQEIRITYTITSPPDWEATESVYRR
ncbi:hypothetical protein DRQ05_01650 [bacterium]|nr:MAG: hypothetical protein DRQ05_01650 [bacterium]